MDQKKRQRVDEQVVIDETVERVLYRSRRLRTVLTMCPPASTRSASTVHTLKENSHEEEPTKNAELRLKITDVPDTAPSERAEVNIKLADSEGKIHVPGRFTGQLLDGCVAVGCILGAGITTKWVLEAANDSSQGNIALAVVVVQIIGIAVLAWRAIRRQR
uniref:hypothetical protein n=1 Tax=Actinoplanes sp. CA-151224 TaxID=3239904 RepID=UPI003F49787C